MNIEISAIIFISASIYVFYIFSIKRTGKKREGAGMTKLNIATSSMQSMKTTIKVETATRKRIRILAARLDVDMDEAINRAAECLESSPPGEEGK